MTMPGGSDVEVRATLEDELSRPLEDVRRQVRRTAGDVEDAGKKANRGARGFDRMAAGVGRLARNAGKVALKGVAAGIGVVAGAAAFASVKLVSLAMDAAETASKFGTVFAGVPGDVGGYLDDLSSRFGLVTKDLQDAAANFGVFGKAAGIPKDALGAFSKDLVGAGTDLASFYNADPTEVFQALRSGLSGEAEPLRQFGIFLSDAAMKAEAATMGLTGELTESQKVMVRQRIIMASLGDAQGDLERTSGGLSNQWKKLKGNLTNAGTAIGTALLPYATQLVVALNDRLSPAVDQLVAGVPTMTAKLERAGQVAQSVYAVFRAAGLESAVSQLDTMTGAGGRLSGAFDLLEPIVADVVTVVRDALIPAVRDVAGAIDPSWLTPLGLARLALGVLADNAGLARVGLTVLVAALTVAKVWTLAVAAANGVAAARTAVHTAAVTAHTVASKVATAAAKAWAAGQWILNAALTANPIGAVVVGIGLLVGGLVLAYRKSETFRNVVDSVWRALKRMGRAAGDALGKLKDAVTFDVPFIGGDTAAPRGRGGGIGSTLAAHASIAGVTGTRPQISNAFVGGGGRGHGSGDHQAGRALDLVGSGLGAYARETRRRGGYAAYHGSGRTRHLHTVPAIGDTRQSMARRISTSTGTQAAATTAAPVVIGAGAIVVQGLTAEEAAAAVADGIDAYVRDREERR